MLAEINNCNLDIKFEPKLVYPGKYFVVARCLPMEKALGLEGVMVKVSIDGVGNVDKLPASCLNLDCPLIKPAK